MPGLDLGVCIVHVEQPESTDDGDCRVGLGFERQQTVALLLQYSIVDQETGVALWERMAGKVMSEYVVWASAH